MLFCCKVEGGGIICSIHDPCCNCAACCPSGSFRRTCVPCVHSLGNCRPRMSWGSWRGPKSQIWKRPAPTCAWSWLCRPRLSRVAPRGLPETACWSHIPCWDSGSETFVNLARLGYQHSRTLSECPYSLWEVFRDVEIKEELVKQLEMTSLIPFWAILRCSDLRWQHSYCRASPLRGEDKETMDESEDDIIGMVNVIITFHTSTGKASEFTFIAVKEYRNFTCKEGTTIAEYAN